MTATETKLPKLWVKTKTVSGFTEEGKPEVTHVDYGPNPDWSASVADSEYRYLIRVVNEFGDELDCAGADTREDALAVARIKIAEVERDYEGREDLRREQLAEALGELAESQASEGSPEEKILEAIAGAISGDRAGEVLAALKAAGLA